MTASTATAPWILSGFLTTVELVGDFARPRRRDLMPIAAGRLSRNPVIATLAYAYSYFFRGTPLIAQIFLIYYGAGQFALQLRGYRPLVVLPRRL